MKLGKGVEWAAHTCALLALLPPGAALPGEALADFLGVPPPYLAKQLQALSRAGIVTAQRGAAGGYRLSRLPDTVTLWDITAAVEGTAVKVALAIRRLVAPGRVLVAPATVPKALLVRVAVQALAVVPLAAPGTRAQPRVVVFTLKRESI